MKNYSRSWPHTGHVHTYYCHKNHYQRSSLIKEFLGLLVVLGAISVVFALGVVLVGVPFGNA